MIGRDRHSCSGGPGSTGSWAVGCSAVEGVGEDPRVAVADTVGDLDVTVAADVVAAAGSAPGHHCPAARASSSRPV